MTLAKEQCHTFEETTDLLSKHYRVRSKIQERLRGV